MTTTSVEPERFREQPHRLSWWQGWGQEGANAVLPTAGSTAVSYWSVSSVRRDDRAPRALAGRYRLARALPFHGDVAEDGIEAEVVEAFERAGDKERCAEGAAERGAGDQGGERPR